MKRARGWILAAFLAAAVLLPALRAEALGWNEYYDVYVGDKQVSKWTADDVLGDGTVSYDAAAHTLYLNNAHIYGFTGILYGEAPDGTDRDFTIVSKGRSTVETYDCCTTPTNMTAYAVRSRNFSYGPGLNIRGSGTLNLFATNSEGYEEGIAVGGNVAVTGSLTVNVRCGETTDGGGGVIAENGDGTMTIGGSVKLVIQGVDRAFYKTPVVYADGYIPRVRAGSSADNITVDEREPAAEVYTDNPYICITKMKKNPMTVKISPVTVKYSRLKKKTQKIAAKDVFAVTKAKGKVTYTVVNTVKKISVSSKGKITIMKGLARGTYRTKVKVKAAGGGDYLAKTKTVTVKIKVVK